ncbi:MAG: hypothetical protein H0X39_13195 [Actinobacteria bacterium]|nr:hypothetical protein [Actinomycetota bacterium]
MTLFDALERRLTLTSAVARLEQLRTRDSQVELTDESGKSLSRGETLELLALGEIIAHKAGYGRQLVVGRAREAGASWAEIGQALGVSRQSAWEAHTRWIDAQAEQHQVNDYEGLDDEAVALAREAAGAAHDE